METGFIKIQRKFLKWEWYSDINTKVLFLHLLFKANWADAAFQGTVIKRGSLVTSNQKLALETGLSSQQIRTCLKKLQNTSEITIKSTNKYTVITLMKYGVYQDNDTNSNKQNNILSNKRITNEQQTDNKRITTIEEEKEEKEYKEEKEIHMCVVNFLNENAKTKFKSSTSQTKLLIDELLAQGFTLDDFKLVIKHKCEEWLYTDFEKHLCPETLFSDKFEKYLNVALKKYIIEKPNEFVREKVQEDFHDNELENILSKFD